MVNMTSNHTGAYLPDPMPSSPHIAFVHMGLILGILGIAFMIYWHVNICAKLRKCVSWQCVCNIDIHKHGFSLIPAWISNHIHYKVWDEITFLFPIFNGSTVEVWEWISNFIPHFIGHVVTYPCWAKSQTLLVKGAPGVLSTCQVMIY